MSKDSSAVSHQVTFCPRINISWVYGAVIVAVVAMVTQEVVIVFGIACFSVHPEHTDIVFLYCNMAVWRISPAREECGLTGYGYFKGQGHGPGQKNERRQRPRDGDDR